MTFSPVLLRRLSEFDTPTICNAIELFEIRPKNTGYMNQRISASVADMRPMVGFAATATFRSSSAPESGDAYDAIDRQLQQLVALPGPGIVVFQDLDEPSVGATFGEVMCSSFKAFGSVGLITSGAGRDLEQVRALEYPVFTGGTICSHANSHIVNLGTQVQVGGLTVGNGNLLHGDTNGVTHVPAELATEIIDVAEEYVAAERDVIEYTSQAGQKHISELVELRREMGIAIAKLRRRVSRKSEV